MAMNPFDQRNTEKADNTKVGYTAKKPRMAGWHENMAPRAGFEPATNGLTAKKETVNKSV